MMELTRKQVDNLIQLKKCKKGWQNKTQQILSMLRSYGINDMSEGMVYEFMEFTLPKISKNIEKERYRKQISGQIKTNITPTDIKGDFEKVDDPKVGGKYHVSWAHSGCVFLLEKIESKFAFLQNPKNKRKSLLKVKLSDLRHLRKSGANK